MACIGKQLNMNGEEVPAVHNMVVGKIPDTNVWCSQCRKCGFTDFRTLSRTVGEKYKVKA